MSFTPLLFYIFSAVLIFAAFRVITAKNPVHAALFLVLTFFQASMIWMLLKAEFLSITLVLVYVGAVMVLFLFVVMMMDINIENLREGFWTHFPLAALVAVVIILEMAAIFSKDFSNLAINSSGFSDIHQIDTSNTKELGKLLFTKYVYALEVAAAILLVAMIAAIALTLRARKDSKYASPADQVRVRASDRLMLVKMPPTQVKIADASITSEVKS